MTITDAETQTKQATGTVRLHRVLRAPPERIYKAILDPGRKFKMASAARLHLHGPPPRRQSGRYL